MGMLFCSCLSLARRLCWDANASGADIEMAMLVVTAVWCGGVEVQFDINSIGRKKIVVVIGMWLYLEVLKPLTPLL